MQPKYIAVICYHDLKVIPLEEVFLKKYVRNEKDDEMDLEVNTAEPEVSSRRLSRDLAMDVMTIGISLFGCASTWYADGGRSRVRSSRPAKYSFVDLVMKTFLRPFSPFR